MKSVIVFALLVAAVCAAPGGDADVYKIVDNNRYAGTESFNFDEEASDGEYQQASGQVLNPGAKDEALEVTGHYSYVGNDGVTYQVTYTAGTDGFKPQGAHLPQTA